MPDVSSSTSGAIVVISPVTLQQYYVGLLVSVDNIDFYMSVLGPIKKRVTKNGRMARTSTMFIPSFRKAHLSGEPASLMKYSRVNQAMQTVSIMAKVGLSMVLPMPSLYWRTSRVLIVIPTMETATNIVDKTEMICQKF